MKRLLVAFLLANLVLVSCKSTKVVTENGDVIKRMSARKIAKKHLAATPNFKTADAKLKVNYKSNNEKIGFSVKMKIKKDEVIWLKGTKLITVFKAKITPEKVSFYSPYKKNYFEGDFSMLKKLLGIDVNFYQLQNILLGQAVFDLNASKHTSEIKGVQYQVSPKEQSPLFDLFYLINPKNYKLNKQLVVNDLKEQELSITYPEYINKNEILFPKTTSIKATEKNKFTNIDLTVRSIVFNEELSMPFKIPSGYKEIKL